MNVLGKVRGLAYGVIARDTRNLCHQVESPLILRLLKEMQTLENQVDMLNVKLGKQASATQPELASIMVPNTCYLPFL